MDNLTLPVTQIIQVSLYNSSVFLVSVCKGGGGGGGETNLDVNKIYDA